MTRKPSKPAWWQLPAIIGGCVVGVGAMGTGVVKLAGFLTITDRVEAGEQKNTAQDKQIDRLITLQEYYAKQQQAPNQAAPPPAPAIPVEPEVPAIPAQPAIWIEPVQVEGRWVCTDGRARWWADPTLGCE